MGKGFKIAIISLLVIIIILLGVVIGMFIKGDQNESPNTPTNDTQITNPNETKEETTSQENNEATTDNGYISTEKALDIALDHAKLDKNDIHDLSIELDYKNNKNVYEIDFNYKNYDYEYYVDAKTGISCSWSAIGTSIRTATGSSS